MAVEEMGGVVLRLPASWPGPLDVIEALEQVRPRSSRAKTRRAQPPDSARPRVRPIILFRLFSSNVRATCPEPR